MVAKRKIHPLAGNQAHSIQPVTLRSVIEKRAVLTEYEAGWDPQLVWKWWQKEKIIFLLGIKPII
jgi:hypothetical protein